MSRNATSIRYCRAELKLPRKISMQASVSEALRYSPRLLLRPLSARMWFCFVSSLRSSSDSLDGTGESRREKKLRFSSSLRKNRLCCRRKFTASRIPFGGKLLLIGPVKPDSRRRRSKETMTSIQHKHLVERYSGASR